MRWERGQVSGDECKDTALVCKNKLRKVKSCQELETVRDKKYFYN